MTINTTITPEGRHHKEILVDGKSVSRLSIVPHEMRIGCATVRMGGIGGVHTDKKHRRKGYSRRVMSESVEYMLEEGFDMSMLFGIRDFYPKFGYVTALAQHTLTLPVPDIEDTGGPYTARRMTDEDTGRMTDLYNEENAIRTCSVVRDRARWTHFPKGSRFRVPATALVIEDQDGTVVAYAAFDDIGDAVNIVEVAAATDDVFPRLVRESVRLANLVRTNTITIFAPPDHPFIEHCHRYDCHATANYRADGAGMLRIINLRSTLEKTIPEFEARLARDVRFAAREEAETVVVRIATDIGATVLEVQGGSVSVRDEDSSAGCGLRVPQTILTQLLIGYRSLRSVLGEDAVSVSGDCADLLEALFPGGPGQAPSEPYIWAADHF